MGLSSKLGLLFFLIITKKTLTPLLRQCNLQAGSLGRVEEKHFVGGAANASRKREPARRLQPGRGEAQARLAWRYIADLL